ncbi:MAG: hypothetical protein HY597_03170 [Candidatus Omnitrophica bacterium]|nr:hypothetical protein [Candidatus Omnitrophota bacterium]
MSIGLLGALWVAVPDASAVQVKAVYRGTMNFDADDIVLTATLPSAVDVSKSIVLVSINMSVTNNARDQNPLFIASFEDGTTVSVTRGGANQTATASWQVIEFADGVFVQRGMSSFTDTVKIKTITLGSTFDTTKTFPILQVNGALTTATDTEVATFNATFPANNQITIARLRSASEAGITKTVSVGYQVVSFLTDASVRTGTATIAYNQTAATVSSLSPAIADVNKAFLVYTFSGNGNATSGIDGMEGLLLVRGKIADTTTLTFTRAASSTATDDTVDIVWYLVEMSDSNTLVQRNTTTFTTTSTSPTFGTAIDTSRGILLFGYAAGDNATQNLLDDLSTRGEVTGTTGLTFTRAGTASESADWEVAEFPPLTLTYPNGGEVLRVGQTPNPNITWTCSNSAAGHTIQIAISGDGGLTYPDTVATVTSGCTSNAGSYAWTIPDSYATIGNVIQNDLRLKITDTTDATNPRNFDVSNANLEIKGQVTLTAPDGGEVWFVGDTTRNIVWTKQGNLDYSSLTLKLSTDGGGSYPTTIATLVVPSSLSYNWNPIPNNTCNANCKVLAELAADAANVTDVSNGNFSIRGSLTITAPNGTESWPATTSQTITWNKTGTFATVKLEYSTNSGGTYPNVIATGLTAGGASGSYAWTVPIAGISTFARVKVTNEADANVTDESNADFAIVPSLKVTRPDNGTEVFYVGTSEAINWTVNGAIANVKLEYSTNGFSDELQTVQITASTPADPAPVDGSGSYNWTIPDAIGSTVKVRVSEVGAPTRNDVSDNNFKIRGKITVVYPNGGEVFPVGSSQVLSWTKDGSLGNVDLLYSTNGGSAFPNTIVTNQAGTTYNWTPIPDVVSTTIRVRVQGVTNAAETVDGSDANLAIKGSLTLTGPNGGELWGAGTAQTIAWNKSGTMTDVKLEYSTNSGSTYPNVIVASTPADTDPPAGANNGQYAWTLPGTVGTQFRVKVTLLSDTTVFDTSNGDFSIRGSVTLTAPNGGQTWIVGTQENITWSLSGSIANVKLEYSTDGGSTYPAGGLITASTAAAPLSYTWTIPDAIGTVVRVRVSDAGDATVNDPSDTDFTIKGSLTLTAPNGGQTWIVGTSQNVTWTKSGTLPNVKLEYSADGGITYPNVIIASVPGADLSYPWTIPDTIDTDIRVRVSYDTTPDTLDLSDTSNANFTIKGSLTLTAPNGTEQWPINSGQTIAWTKTGTLTGNLKLEYSVDGGATYLAGNLISNTVAASSTSYAWTVPDNPSTQARVKVTYLNDTSVFDESNANFSIKGSVTVTAPNTAVTWLVGESRNVTWIKGGAIANVKIDYSTDGGATYPNAVVASTPASNLSYAWTVPDAIGTQLRVRITDAADATVLDASDVNFSIKATLAMTSPNGGETWIVGESRNIIWNKTGTIANVKLEYSTDGGTSYLAGGLIVASTAGETDPPTGAGNGQYAWTVPDAIGTNLMVKVTNLADTSVNDQSDAAFTIKGSLTMSSPNGSEVWIVGESRDIVWTMVGTIANVKLEYSKNAFFDESQTFQIIASTTAETNPPTGAGNGQYAWTVSDAIGTNLKVRVSSTADATVKDVSDAAFAIKGKLTITAPNGGESWVALTANNITWTRDGSIANAKLEYTKDGTTYASITTSTDASLGTFNWTVADDLSSTAKVRITNTADATVFDESNANFKITGSLTLTSPNGGEKWTYGGAAQNIVWTKNGTALANVKLEYSTDGGTTYPNLIIGSTPAGSAFAWTIPNTPSATCRVKVSDASDATVFDVSNANFKIKASLTVVSPNGGEIWAVASPQTINWNTTGTVVNAKLDYSTDGGVSYPNPITASTTNTGTYSWTIPNAISTSVRVKVTDAADVDATDASDANFKIRGVLVLSAPNGGEQWGIATPQNIAWTRTGSVANVKLEYSTNGFTDELQNTTIIASTAADPLPADDAGTYAWTIPDTPGSTVKVRVSDATDATVSDASNANFSIKGSVTLTAPNGGESWIVGSSFNITWTLGGSLANVKLQYSTDGGLTWPDPGKVIVASTAASALSYTWTIPDDVTALARVRITYTDDTSVYDDSNANFAIRGSLSLTAPNGSENWIVGDSQNITWTKTGTIATVKLDFSTDGGTTYPNVITASVASTATPYAWVIPDAISSQVRVKVTSTADSVVTDASDANLAIKGSLTLTSPNGGEVWGVATSQPINWSRVGSIGTAKLEYSTDGGVTYPNTIINPIASSLLTYNWTVPDAITTTARVKITNLADVTVNDTSNGNFKIAGSLVVTAPNGGEQWGIGLSKSITWTKGGSIVNVKLEYSTDSGATYPNVIIASVDATAGTPYAWTVPDVPSATVRVKVTNISDTTVFDASDANFKIQGSFTLTAPNGGQVWLTGESRSITWTKGGSIANAKLEYSTDGGVTYPNLIVGSTPAATLSYAWTVPDALGTQLRVKITDAADAAVFDTSDANSTIKGTLTVTAPNGGESWIVGTSQNVTWTRNGSIANVKLEYSKNGFADELQTFVIVASTLGGNLSYGWTVPDAIGNTVKVRVSDTSDATVNDLSNGNFAIKGALTVTAPNGGETLIVGGSTNITWTKSGSIANVKLEYSTNAFANELQTVVITASTSAAALSYAWTVPDAISNTLKVRITDASDASVLDTSNTNFTIKGSLTVTAPNGGENWVVATGQTITWNRAGSIPNVKLQYTTDGAIYTDIIASTGNTGSYAWTIPNTTTTTGMVKVIDTSDATVNDASDANFRIQAGFTLTAPNGGENFLVGSSQNITWNTQGTVGFVKLDYSTDSGTTYPSLIVSSTGNTGTYGWTVPDNVSGAVRVRVADASDATAFDTSNANLRIRAAFTLSAPNGAEQWRVGQTNNITWSTLGTIPNVKLQYSRDNFVADIQTIIASVTNASTYAWTVPDTISNTVRVKVSDPNDIGAFDASNADFRITGNFTIVTPNTGTIFVGDPLSITWTSAGTMPNAKLEYSTDGGATFPNVIVGLTTNSGTYAWTVPNNITQTGRFRVSDAADATANDLSDFNVKIMAKFTLSSPVGGEVWVVGESRNITWTNTGTVGTVRLEYSTNGGSTYTLITSAATNTGTYAWTVPDAISGTVRVKVGSSSDFADSAVFSAANVKIRGSLTLTAPNGTELWGIAQLKTITWTTVGTIANVKLSYSTNGGTTYPNVIAASVTNTGTYAWTVPDVPSATARLRVEDVADTTVFDDSNANFSLVGNFTLTAPNGGETWLVNEARNITWSWGGTIPNVKLTYSTDGGTTYPNVIAASAPNGPGSSGSFSYAWTIPNNISATVRVRIEDVNNAAAFDVSDANFKIAGKLTLSAPNGGERWVTNESRTITWTSAGTISNVKLEYSTDGGTTYPNVITASATNAGTYTWTVPDNRSTTVRVRVSNAADATVFDASDTNFEIDYYTITWVVKDLLTNGTLDQLSVSATDGWAGSGLTAPVVRDHKYGAYTATWSKTSYGDQAVNFTADQDQTINVFMETQVVHIYEVKTTIAYSATTDSAGITTTLSRDGSIVSGVTSGTVKVYDGATVLQTFTSTTPDAQGFYRWTWNAPTGLVSGKAYSIVSTASIATGGVFNTPSSFSITQEAALKAVTDTIATQLDKPLSLVESGIQTQLNTQLGLIDTKLTAQTSTIDTKLTSFETSSNAAITSLKSEAVNVGTAAGKVEATNLKYAGKLLLPLTVLAGTKNVELKYRGEAGKQPLIDIFDASNKKIVSAAPMTESSDQPGLYVYTVKEIESTKYIAGKIFTVVVQESTTGNLEAGGVLVESTSLTTLEGLVSSSSGTKPYIQQTLDAVKGVQAILGESGNVGMALENLNRKVDVLPSKIAKEGSAESKEMKQTINTVAEQIKALAGDQGYDFSQLIQKGLEESASIKSVRKQADRITGTTELMQKLFEQKMGGLDAPVVHVIFE